MQQYFSFGDIACYYNPPYLYNLLLVLAKYIIFILRRNNKYHVRFEEYRDISGSQNQINNANIYGGNYRAKRRNGDSAKCY